MQIVFVFCTVDIFCWIEIFSYLYLPLFDPNPHSVIEADSIPKYFVLYFPEKIRLDISCELSAIHMKYPFFFFFFPFFFNKKCKKKKKKKKITNILH